MFGFAELALLLELGELCLFGQDLLAALGYAGVHGGGSAGGWESKQQETTSGRGRGRAREASGGMRGVCATACSAVLANTQQQWWSGLPVYCYTFVDTRYLEW